MVSLGVTQHNHIKKYDCAEIPPSSLRLFITVDINPKFKSSTRITKKL
nr:MAG TPA: hypothetical protein [Microviridae sp.]